MKRLSLLAIFVLGACAETPPPLDVTVACPPLTTWTVADQAALAATLSPIPSESILWKLEMDWQRTRDAIKACRAANRK